MVLQGEFSVFAELCGHIDRSSQRCGQQSLGVSTNILAAIFEEVIPVTTALFVNQSKDMAELKVIS